MPHQPAWHILDNVFTDEDLGFYPPERRIVDPYQEAVDVCRTDMSCEGYNTICIARYRLRITNLDHNDPPHYTAGRNLRSNQFNANSGSQFRINAEPRMPAIRVNCEVAGFDPNDNPIYWRLQCRHVLGRHQPQGHYQYRGACEILEAEWQGRSFTNDFTLFAPSSSETLKYDYNDNTPSTVVMGGNAILTVAAMPPGCFAILQDYVHMRIGGTNPAQANVTAYVNADLGSRNPNLPHMVNAIFTHENNFKQFADNPQRSTRMIFRQKHHANNPAQPDCSVSFDWPDDPEHFPSVSFDWGVGISQYTKIRGRTIGSAAAWDWRYNINRGINEFLDALADQYRANLTWREWAHRAWRAYNGSGPQAEQYANTVEALPEGQAVSNLPMPGDADTAALTAHLSDPPALGQPPTWPPFLPPGDYPEPVGADRSRAGD